MPARITRIECAGPESRARRVVFDDDSSRTTSAAAIRTLGVEEGAEMKQSVLEDALAEIEPDLAKEHAVRLLGHRERSSAELARRLRNAGYPGPIVSAVVARFTELELVDDVRFASMWARSRAASGYGRRRVSRELAEKGIAPETAEPILDELFAEATQTDRAEAALRGARPRTRAEREKLLRRLIARGFDFGTAIAALNRVAGPDDQVDGG